MSLQGKGGRRRVTLENIPDGLNLDDILKKITPKHHNLPKQKKNPDIPGNKSLRGNFVAC